MAARICPQCRTRVDERRAKASPYCLSCGAPLGTAPPTSYGTGGFAGKPAPKSPLPWILGGIAAFLLLALGGFALLVVAAAGKDEPETATAGADPTSVPNVETPTAQPSVSVVPTATAKIAGTVKVPLKPPPPPTAPPPTTAPVVLGAFPRAQANNDLDRVTAGLGSCKRAGDPTGSGSIRVDFEPDGRVGTVLAKPFAGTPTGSCISARYLAIRVGAFQGSTQTLTRTFAIAGSSARPNDPGF